MCLLYTQHIFSLVLLFVCILWYTQGVGPARWSTCANRSHRGCLASVSSLYATNAAAHPIDTCSVLHGKKEEENNCLALLFIIRRSRSSPPPNFHHRNTPLSQRQSTTESSLTPQVSATEVAALRADIWTLNLNLSEAQTCCDNLEVFVCIAYVVYTILGSVLMLNFRFG